MKISKTAYAILGVLSIEPMSGYAIREFMKQSTSRFWAESDGQIYPALKNLLTDKCIKLTKKNTHSKKNEHRKIEYAITQTGKTILKEWLMIEAEKNSIRDEFILKLFYSANIDAAITVDHVRKKIYDIKSSISVLKNTKKELTQYEKISEHYIYWDMITDYGLTIMNAKLHWCESVIKRLKSGEK